MNPFIVQYLAQLEGEPESPSPLTEGASRIFEVGRETSAAVASNFDPLWRNVIQGGLYQAMANLGAVVAVLALGFFLVQWAQQLLSQEGDKAFSEMIWPVIVIVFLARDGDLMGKATLEFRDVANQVNNTVLASAVKNESLQQQFQQTRLGSEIDNIEAASISECRETYGGRRADRLANCIRQARRKANETRQQYGLIPAEEPSWAASIIQWVVRNILWAMHMDFQWAIEIILLIVALFGPLAMGLSLLPGSGKAVFSWLSGLVSVYLMKLSLNLISGIAAYAVSLQSGGANALLLPVLLGILAPILSVMVGLQGGAAFLNSLATASVYGGFRLAPKAAKKGAAITASSTKALFTRIWRK